MTSIVCRLGGSSLRPYPLGREALARFWAGRTVEQIRAADGPVPPEPSREEQESLWRDLAQSLTLFASQPPGEVIDLRFQEPPFLRLWMKHSSDPRVRSVEGAEHVVHLAHLARERNPGSNEIAGLEAAAWAFLATARRRLGASPGSVEGTFARAVTEAENNPLVPNLLDSLDHRQAVALARLSAAPMHRGGHPVPPQDPNPDGSGGPTMTRPQPLPPIQPTAAKNPRSGLPLSRLKAERIQVALSELPGWSLSSDQTALVRGDRLPSDEAVEIYFCFVRAIGRAVGQQPQITVDGRTVEVRLSTPEAGGVTAADLVVARWLPARLEASR